MRVLVVLVERVRRGNRNLSELRFEGRRLRGLRGLMGGMCRWMVNLLSWSSLADCADLRVESDKLKVKNGNRSRSFFNTSPSIQINMATAQSAPLEASTSTSSTLTPDLFKRLHPSPYLTKFLDQQVRPDGRPLAKSQNVWRDASVNLGELTLSC